MIDRFTGKYEFLSNFYYSPMVLDFIAYPTAEHAFQAEKTDDRAWKYRIADCTTPQKAKSLGRRVPLREGWDDLRISAMRRVVHAKFDQNPALAAGLVSTGELLLVEGNTWNDRFWGVSRGRGRNELGKILMEVRSGYFTEV